MDKQRIAKELVEMARSLVTAESWVSVAARVIDKQMGFLTDRDTPVLRKAFPRMAVLVRTGMARYVAPIKDLDKVFKMVEDEGDYVRDVSVPSKSYDQFVSNGTFIDTARIVKK